MEQDIPQESLIVRLSQQMTGEFDKILMDSRSIKRTLDKLATSEVSITLTYMFVEKPSNHRGVDGEDLGSGKSPDYQDRPL